MNFEDIWEQYDFTEAELLSMGWEFPYNYVLNLNYYWELNPTNTNSEVATTEQPLKLILKSCIRLDIQFNSNPHNLEEVPANLGTITGWGQVSPSPWIGNLSLSPDEWLHLFFDIGGNNKIQAVCQSLVIEKVAQESLALTS
ncbi:hypothetical protein [Nodularia spumigena]|jgi:hypothetical protein|uniref:Peptidase S1 domain-containing protein n=1 Tax=Nodularia spumigena UHCC 0060 TaxID=3110300 RepID=A0ABU5UVC5_NODSP|nr:hypothetical protein [Nodularia spumigena]MEA5527657.1 hypothetical protein [Nodularia spumigena UHCC 0143]MEA5559480.1 hypothetical protein [Nodularia spumigena CH309]MEA5609798.1 hypothetical protein [Nodularia spumigena UHCC 0060]MEA5615658.1 hypothetical protein [Nodularia spumigena UHCC 0040]